MAQIAKAKNQAPLSVSGTRDGIRWDLLLNHGSNQIFSAVKRKSTDARPHAIHLILDLGLEGRSELRLI
jgi:hypothetical protein